MHSNVQPSFKFISSGLPNESGGQEQEIWEDDAYNRVIPLDTNEVWVFPGSSRVVESRPEVPSSKRIRIHLWSRRRFTHAKLYMWWHDPHGVIHELPLQHPAGFDIVGSRQEHWRNYWDVQLSWIDNPWFLFKYVNETKDGFQWEIDQANRVWTDTDGDDIWVHSDAMAILSARPNPRELELRIQTFSKYSQPYLHFWQQSSDFTQDLPPYSRTDDHVVFRIPRLFPGVIYRGTISDHADGRWERVKSKDGNASDGRSLSVSTGSSRQVIWGLDGVYETFSDRPLPSVNLEVHFLPHPTKGWDLQSTCLHAWTGLCPEPFASSISALSADSQGYPVFSVPCYPGVSIGFTFFSSRNTHQEWDSVDHWWSSSVVAPVYVVQGRDSVTQTPLGDQLFLPCPFSIPRPGAWRSGSEYHFVLYAPHANIVRLSFPDLIIPPISMHLEPGNDAGNVYWWASIPVYGKTDGISYQLQHGTCYQYSYNDPQVNWYGADPAANWITFENDEPHSRLADPDQYEWTSNSPNAWQAGARWETTVIYELHVSRFSNRKQGLSAFARVTEELLPGGYLRELGVTAIELMPINENPGIAGWGYGPTYYFAPKYRYGTPDELCRLIDVAHAAGIAVILDVVFNHASTQENPLWDVAHRYFFCGDSEWGAMPDFGHEKVLEFFGANLLHWVQQYRMDGFRFDMTKVIRRAGESDGPHIRQPGSPFGWSFLQQLASMLKSIHPAILLIAEDMDNNWGITRPEYQGPFDAQWHDRLRHRLVESIRAPGNLPELADALLADHQEGGPWHDVINYAESHDEVGNRDERIARIGGWGFGLRASKVALSTCLLSRGIPMVFMGEESGETAQFTREADDYRLPLSTYLQPGETNPNHRIWEFTRQLLRLRKDDPAYQGASPLRVSVANDEILCFTRGSFAEVWVILHFGRWNQIVRLSDLGFPNAQYSLSLSSTDSRYQVEGEPGPGTSLVASQSITHLQHVKLTPFSAWVFSRWNR